MGFEYDFHSLKAREDLAPHLPVEILFLCGARDEYNHPPTGFCCVFRDGGMLSDRIEMVGDMSFPEECSGCFLHNLVISDEKYYRIVLGINMEAEVVGIGQVNTW